ncbi:phage-related major capsid protein [Leifsonia xyli subsp. cynodontis DSM 46306]|uniref:Uncharacterized protein n=1 Tax=Leifsonia xyli subsp. cynodontis DSM 46306 TaxID=1389489 RepID=U3PDW4_LEIXC|nr:hypothetical protein [Leifsonia xyli]AGW41753.1 phage-related major capsid protein [Leifsonia xyli subsp. cynodontis DSM 46306]
MASTKQRTVYFFEPIVLDQAGNVQPIEGGFWSDLHDRISNLDDNARRGEFFGRRHIGSAREETTPPEKYLYVGKLRPGADWPDVSDGDGAIASLASTGFSGSLIEPAYLLGVSGTNYVAILRSSAGPSFTAIARWLNMVCEFNTEAERLELRSYVRRDQLERFNRAKQAAKIYLKVDPGVMTDAEPKGELGQALKIAQSAGAGGASVELTISFGNVRPTDRAGEDLVTNLRELLFTTRTPFKKAKATVIAEDQDGALIRDKIDFTLDRITVQQKIGASEDEEPTPTIVLQAMLEAIGRFRSELPTDT